MKKGLMAVAAVFLGVLLLLSGALLSAQTSGRTLTLIYSNNINAELDPCPT